MDTTTLTALVPLAYVTTTPNATIPIPCTISPIFPVFPLPYEMSGLYCLMPRLHLEMIPIGGAIRALMMGIHAYFNIWCEARAGWVVFMKRRTAVHKISSLPEATTAQLQQFDDVCAICYQVNC